MNLVNQIVQGVLLGGYYAMLASGLSFLFGVMRIVNLAHGSLVVLAAYLILALSSHFGWNVAWATLATMPIMAGLGWLLNRALLQRSMRGGALIPILATFGLSIVLDNLLFQRFGADTRSLAPNIGDLAYNSWQLGDNLYVSKLDVLTFGCALLMLGGLQLVLSRTALGRAIRATAEDPEAVDMIGIDARAVYSACSAIALVLVTAAGLFLGMRASFTPYAGDGQLIFAFESVVIGGVGSLWGTLLGGVVLGVAQSLGAQISPLGFLIGGHVVFLAILILRLYAGQFRFLFAAARMRLAPSKGASA